MMTNDFSSIASVASIFLDDLHIIFIIPMFILSVRFYDVFYNHIFFFFPWAISYFYYIYYMIECGYLILFYDY